MYGSTYIQVDVFIYCQVQCANKYNNNIYIQTTKKYIYKYKSALIIVLSLSFVLVYIIYTVTALTAIWFVMLKIALVENFPTISYHLNSINGNNIVEGNLLQKLPC